MLDILLISSKTSASTVRKRPQALRSIVPRGEGGGVVDQQSSKSVSQLDESVPLFIRVGLCRVNVRAYLHHLPRKQEQDH